MDQAVIGVEPWGGRTKAFMVDHYGPASYVTGGESWPQQSTFGGPNSAGLNGVNWVNGGITEDGTYRVVPVTGGGGSKKGQIKLVWYVVATGAQVAAAVNLSASHLRLLVLGG